ncbi:hypothetical protein B0H63DRAFT_475498 [Podospora didyma]|uniref:Delta(24)-sterol reductase n=1 Tax=Podospora didyma TaxID=330526 RepID=A0AAE0NGX9_9PEZI|nr:hypothetical protein B0H63DRAFT_475498 [Podospora didyma]
MAMERHAATVARIATTVRGYFERSESYRIFHGSTNSTRPARSSNARVVDISDLRHVLSVDPGRRIALIEPNVPMDRLVEATLPHGLVPPVVMEFPGITAGGGYAGTAGESSSFRHGFFDDTVASVEMVLADGEVRRVSREPGESPDLFRGAAGAVGTFGVATLLELRLMKACKFVKTEYRRTTSVAEAVAAVREATRDPANDYVDGILFSKDHGVVVTGRLTDEKPEGVKAQTFSGAWDPWFYLHAKEKTATAKAEAKALQAAPDSDTATATTSSVDYVPLAEYLFRYDRGGFWVGAAAFQYFWMVPFTRFTRWFLDDFLHTRMMYRALHGSGESARFVVQDIAMPFETAEALVDYTAAELNIWPLWLCPLKRRAPPTFHPFTTPPSAPESTTTAATTTTTTTTAQSATPEQEQQQKGEEDQMMLNVGVWGWGPAAPDAFVAQNRALEERVHALGGMKWLYAHTYYPQSDFWNIYGGRAWYDALRTKYRATTLPSVWDKVHVDPSVASGNKRHWLKSVRPLGGLYGIYKSIKSKDYMLHRKAVWNKGGRGE